MHKPTRPKKDGFGLLLKFSGGLKYLFVCSLTASVLGTVFQFLMPQVIRITVDSVIGQEPLRLPSFLTALWPADGMQQVLRGHLLICAGLVIVFAVLSGVCSYQSRMCAAKGSEGLIKRLRDTLFSHIQKLPYRWHAQNQTGDIIQRCTSDVDVIRNFIANQFLEMFRTSFLVVFAFALMFPMNLKMSLVALAFIPVVVAYSFLYFSMVSKKFRAADEAEGALSGAVQENLTGVRVVRAFGRERFEIQRFDEKNNRFAQLWIKLGYVLGSYWGIGDLFTGLQIMLVVILGVAETVNGRITLGEFLVFISYNSILVWPIRGLGSILSEMSKCGVSLSRVNDILRQEEECDAVNAITPPIAGDIVFDNVTFSHPLQQDGAQKPVLKNISFTIKQGGTFAILGGTGSGKSTLVHLLNRLYELPEGRGTITIGGTDIRKIKLSHLRKNIGMVLQEPYLFSRSIQENIGAFYESTPLHEVRETAKIACVDESIVSFSDGYDTIVGERGITLSGGQKQRVAIARMLMQGAPILVFDDSLSAVDSETDAKIRAALKNSLRQTTTIMISHRITTLMQADCILVLKDGEIAEMGTHRQLMELCGIYSDIFTIQMNPTDRDPAFERGNT